MEAYRADVAFDGERVLAGGATVLIRDGVIAGVEPAAAALPEDCPITYLPGTALLPGLIDTHTHPPVRQQSTRRPRSAARPHPRPA
jgi:imidazolonepropionase-like amidohydrolase